MARDTDDLTQTFRPHDIDAYREHDGRNYVDFFEIASAVHCLPAAPRFILGGLSDASCNEMFSGHRSGPAGYYVARDIFVTHDGIMLRDGVMLTSQILNFPEKHCQDILRAMASQTSAAPTVRVVPTAALLFGPGWTTWGHWLVDFLPRFFLMSLAGQDPFGMSWLIPAATPRFARELLHLLGVADDRLVEFDPKREIVSVRELIIPVNLTAGAFMHPLFSEAVEWMKTLIVPQLAARPALHDRIFISRVSNPFWRELSNRVEIEDMAASQGYAVIDPAVLSVADQIAIFRCATKIAGEYGSGLHTSIFSQGGSIITCLRGDVHTAGVLQAGLTKACGQHIGYVIGRSNPASITQAYEIDKPTFGLGLKCAELAALGVFDCN